jgi:hypothetical protein
MRHSYTGFDALACRNLSFLQAARFSFASQIAAAHSHEEYCILFDQMLQQLDCSRFNPN